MKQVMIIAVATVALSPLVLTAVNTPHEVGTVTLLGHIAENSPMWQWTVNDYPYGPLNTGALSSRSSELDGVYYPLSGMPFIAVSGYIPRFVSLTNSSGSAIGVQDKAQLLDNGRPIMMFSDEGYGAVAFHLSAQGLDMQGMPMTGTLTLTGTELRAFRYAYLSGEYVEKWLVVYGTVQAQYPQDNGSCFVGTGRYSTNQAVVSGSADMPQPGEQSPTAFSALVAALTLADTVGSAPPFNDLVEDYETVTNSGQSCVASTLQNGVVTPGMENMYNAGAHILELTPVGLTFPARASGAWSATLTVEAYQM